MWRNFNTYKTAKERTSRTTYHDDITKVVSLATPLERAELRYLIRQYPEARQQRNDLGLSYDDGRANCIDWDGAPLEVEEEGLLALARRRRVEKCAPVDRRTGYEEDVASLTSGIITR